ncbi:MAG: glutathione S-transferase N-terminal domain-containing protein [Myxococcales bacterium]|nr:glutathione S-transferase N-terminal domain-containing protein [Myxococcales bacterium]
MPRALDVATAYAASVARLGVGMKALTPMKRPDQPLELYEFEGCPFCRKVREALSILDLEAMVHPCPRGGEVYRPRVKEMGGRAMFPYLIDPNTGTRMYESADIIAYLFKTYGGRAAPALLRIDPLANATSFLASAVRPKGVRRRPARRPDKPLELWSFEASPYCRIARETLCELELPYLLHNVAKGSPSREAFIARSGKMQVPYLADPNTGTEMFESGDIKAYLLKTYGL